MIMSFRNGSTRRFWEAGKSKFSGLDIEKAEARLAALNAAASIADLMVFRSARLHKLSGDRNDQWAMTINGPWRLCFRFEDSDAFDVEIIDYH